MAHNGNTGNPAIQGAAPARGVRRWRLAALLAAAALAAALAAGAGAAHAAEPAQVIELPAVHEASEIWERWEAMPGAGSGGKYEQEPSLVAPYAAGKVSQAFLEQGLAMLNYMRFVAGLPSDVAFKDELVEEAQYGAALLAAAGFSNTPSKPQDMDDGFYSSAYQAVTECNIGSGYVSLADFVRALMVDSDYANVDRLGHRRWILNPAMLYTGFGYAGDSVAMYSFDASRKDGLADSVAWPAPGDHPLNAFDDNEAWSLSLNPEKYDASRTGEVEVTLTGPSGAAQTFGAADSGGDRSAKYFNVDTQGYGYGYCVVFRPVLAYKAGDEYEVAVSGVYPVGSDAPVTFRYKVRFVSREGLIRLTIGSPDIEVNGVSKKIDEFGTQAMIVNNRTLVPIRAVAEAMGGTVGWLDSEKKVTIECSGRKVELWIGKKTASVDGASKELDTAPQIINSRTMLPVRFVAENLDAVVDWDDAKKQASITYALD